MTAKTWVLCFWGYGKCCSNGEFFQLPYEAGSILSVALFFHLVCSSAAVELVAVKQDGIYIRLRNCTCCLRFPCRTASNYTALVWSCRVLSSNQPTSPEYIMAATPLSSDCHMPQPGTFRQCTVTLRSTKLLPGWGFSGPAPQTSRMACLHH